LITRAIIFAALILFAPSVRAETLTIVGTGDGVTVLENIGRAFSKIYPDVTIKVPPSIGSSGGVKAVGLDKYRLGRVGRPIKEKEKIYGLDYVPYTKLPVVFFVNNNVDVTALSSVQINDIFRGKITNWREVGGKDHKIRIIRRERGDSSLGYLRQSFPGFADVKITKKSRTTLYNSENIDMVSTVPGAIGFGPYADALKAGLTSLIIDGHPPTSPDYPTFGTIGLVFKAKNRIGTIARFVDFCTSKQAFDAIKAGYGIPLSEF